MSSGSALKLDCKYSLLEVSSIKLDLDLFFDGKVVLAAKTISPLFISDGTSHQGTGGVTFQTIGNDEDVKNDQISFFGKDNDTDELFYELKADVEYTYSRRVVIDNY